ncbi:MAG TPA: hypothetical protein VH437_15460 [Terriglobales bacterium]
MSAVRVQLDLTPPPIVRVMQRRSFIAGGIAAVIAVLGALILHEWQQFFRAYLIGFLACLGICLGSMAVLMLRHLTKGGWGMVIRRQLGAAMRTIPYLTLLFVPIALGVTHLYVWTQPLESIHDKKLHEHLELVATSYMTIKGFILRAAIYFAIWNLISFLLTKWSREQDSPTSPSNSRKFKALSAPGIILYAFTISFAGIDWVMSLDPTWSSTMFGLLILVGELMIALAFAIVVERILYRYKPMSELLKPDHVHDHGKLMLTFIMVWAYFSFSQWLILWAGNIPEEITWYIRRLNGGWQFVGLFLAIFQFVVPFVILLSRSFKRDITRLVWLAAWVIIMRFVDLLWLIEPNFSTTLTVTWLDIAVPVAITGIWMGVFFRNLGSLPLVPAYDVDASEVLEVAHE